MSFCFSVLKILGDTNEPAFQIEAIVDPVSSEAQKLAPILLVSKFYLLKIHSFMWLFECKKCCGSVCNKAVV